MALPAAASAVSAAAAGGGTGALLRRVRAADSRAVPADRRENRLFARLLGEAAAALFGLRLSACQALHGYRHRRGEAAFLHGVRKAAALLRLRPAVPRRAAAGRTHALRQLPGDGGHRSGKYELGRCNYEYRTRTYPGRKPEIVSERCTILILDALPRDQFIEVAAHEAAHDWLNHHGRSLPPSWSEGFPEYVASLVNLRHGNGSRNLRMEKNEDPVYGAGFREVKAYADRHGLRKLLEYVRRTR